MQIKQVCRDFQYVRFDIKTLTTSLYLPMRQINQSSRPMQPESIKFSPSFFYPMGIWGFIKSKEMLDRMISTLNQPINGFIPVLNERGQSKLAEYIIKYGWKWSIQELNGSTDMIEDNFVKDQLFINIFIIIMLNDLTCYMKLIFQKVYFTIQEKIQQIIILSFISYTQSIGVSTRTVSETVWALSIAPTQLGARGRRGSQFRMAGSLSLQIINGLSSRGGQTGSMGSRGCVCMKMRMAMNTGASIERGGDTGKGDANGTYQEEEWRDGEEMGRHRYYSKEGVLVDEK